MKYKSNSRTDRADLSTELIPWNARPDGFEQEWEDLFARSEHYGPTYAPAFAIAELNVARNPIVATVRKSGSLVCVLPLVFRKIGCFRFAYVLPRKQIGYSGVLTSELVDDDVFVELGRLLSVNLSLILCSQNDQKSKFSSDALHWFSSEGGLELSVFKAKRSWMALQDSYEELMRSLKSAKRLKKFRWQNKKLNENYKVQVHNFASSDIDEDLIDRVWTIQKSSWMFRRRAANIGRKDVRTLLESLANKGILRVWIMTLDNKDAAMAINFEAHRQIYYKYPAFSLEYERHSIGQILLSHIVDDACARGMTSLDFGHGDTFGKSYKRWWCTHIDGIFRVVYGSTTIGNIVAIAVGSYWTLQKYSALRWLRKSIKRNTKPNSNVATT